MVDMTPETNKVLDNLMSGSIDMHIHFGPESRLKRRQDALQLARTAKKMGMKAIVLKNREYGTAALAQMVQGLVPEVLTIGSFTLDNEAGGLNPGAVLAWIRLGAKVIWMPTATAANSKSKVKRSRGLDLPGEPQTILDAKGNMLPVVKEILALIKEHNVVLGTGHLAPEEVFVLVQEAGAMGIKKTVLTHVQQEQLMDRILTDDEIVRLVGMGAWVEYSYWTCENNIVKSDPKILADSIKKVGAQHCILSTDFGQADNPPAPEGFKAFMGAMLKNGIPEKDIAVMVKTNPAKLLGI
jgi:hypothetical protein